MASTLLTNDMRNGIVARLMKHRYSAEEQTLCDEYAKLMEDAFKYVMGDAYGKLDDFPEGWFPTQSSDYIEIKGVFCEFASKWDSELVKHVYAIKRDPSRNASWRVVFNKSVRVPFNVYHNTPTIMAGHEVHTRAQDLSMRAHKHIEAYDEAKAKARGILNVFSTVEKLVKQWPEIEPFLPPKASAQAAANTLPAVPVEELNSMFGLPPDLE